jgi:hypothetical protein
MDDAIERALATAAPGRTVEDLAGWVRGAFEERIEEV